MISKDALLDLMKEWNFWEREIDVGIIRQEYLEKLQPYMERKEMLVLKGIRRAGKSTIMKQLMMALVKKGVDKKQIIYINLEDFKLRDSLKLELFELILEVHEEYVKKHAKNKILKYVFIDEIQLMPDWEKWVRTKYDLNKEIKFIITGSNASLLSRELSTLLTGRNLTFQIMPLSLIEFFQFRKDADIEEYLTYGGFPEVVLEKDNINKKIILQQYFEDILNKDIIARHNIRNVEIIFNLARIIVSNSGTKTSQNKLAKTLGVSDDTIASYMSYMIDSFLIFKVPYFSYSLKKRHNVKTQPKYYAADNGLIHATSLNFSKDKGKKFENAIFLKLYAQTHDISYWSEKGEVDFVFQDKAINVTSAEKIPEREIQGLIEFSKKHKNFELILISENESEAYEKIKAMSLAKFLTQPL